MKNTKANVIEYATKQGLLSVQLDGIPEGFSFIRESKNIGGKDTGEEYVVFVPHTKAIVTMDTLKPIEELLKLYDKAR